jgi:hypothetical protein
MTRILVRGVDSAETGEHASSSRVAAVRTIGRTRLHQTIFILLSPDESIHAGSRLELPPAWFKTGKMETHFFDFYRETADQLSCLMPSKVVCERGVYRKRRE